MIIISVINAMDNQQESKKNSTNIKLSANILMKSPCVCFLSLFLIPIGVTIIAYQQLSYTGYVPDKAQEEAPFLTIQSNISTFSDSSNSIPLWLVIAIAVCCAAGSFVIFYSLQTSRETQKTSQRTRNSQKLDSQKRRQSRNTLSSPSDSKNPLIILPPEKIYPLTTNLESARNLLNISHSGDVLHTIPFR